MKKMLSIMLAAFLVFSCNTFAFASESTNVDIEYEAAVAEIMKTYQVNPDAANTALAELDTILLEEPSVQEYTCDDTITRGINPTDYIFSVYSFKRGDSPTYYLQWMVESNRDEWYSGPPDYVSLEWDSNYASYYSSNGDGEISSVQERKTGIVLFNVQDRDLDDGKYTYGTVRVTPKKRGTMEFGSKYVHTYTGLLVTGTASYSFSPSLSLSSKGEFTLGVEANYGFSVSLSGQAKKWQIWTDNALYI